MTQTHQFSQEAYDRLKSEYEDLTTRGRIEIAKKIETARELGDLSENGDYHAAKEEQGKMEGRIAHLGSLIENSTIVQLSEDTSTIQAGCIAEILYEGDTEPEKFLIGSIEEKREGVAIMSPGSPLGKELLGAKVGDSVTFESPTGSLAVKVLGIEI